jgi:hypothetical protein
LNTNHEWHIVTLQHIRQRRGRTIPSKKELSPLNGRFFFHLILFSPTKVSFHCAYFATRLFHMFEKKISHKGAEWIFWELCTRSRDSRLRIVRKHINIERYTKACSIFQNARVGDGGGELKCFNSRSINKKTTLKSNLKLPNPACSQFGREFFESWLVIFFTY